VNVDTIRSLMDSSDKNLTWNDVVVLLLNYFYNEKVAVEDRTCWK